MNEFGSITARDLRSRMDSGEISPVDVVTATLQAAHALESSTGAFVSIDDNGAVRAAAESERRYRLGNPRVLEGLPIPLKDLEDTAGLRTTLGLRLYRERIPTRDGSVAALARDAGVVIFGKTTTSSFGHRLNTAGVGPGARAPFDLSRTAGGSSGGAAAAVAAGVCRVAHGTDGGGSVRLPAALCGVVGFKPSYGRIPRWPSHDGWAARTHHGFIARCVDDIAFAMSGFAKVDYRDPLTCWDLVDWSDIGTPGISLGARLAFAHIEPSCGMDADVEESVQAALMELRHAGLSVDDIDLRIDGLAELDDRMNSAATAWALHDMPHDFAVGEPSLLRLIEDGRRLRLFDYMEAVEWRTSVNMQIVSALQGYEYLLTPAVRFEAWQMDAPGPTINGSLVSDLGEHSNELFVFNLLGWPAATVPCGRTRRGHGWTGLQVAARRGRDRDCLRMASFIERVLS